MQFKDVQGQLVNEVGQSSRFNQRVAFPHSFLSAELLHGFRVEKLGNISLSLSAEFARLQVILRRLMAVVLLPYWSTWWRDWLELCLTI